MSHLHQLLLILSLIALTHIHALPWTSIGPTTIDSRTTTGTITHIISNGMTGATIITPGSGLWTTPNIGVNDPTWSHVDVINMCQSIPAFHVYTSNPKWAVAACGTTQRTLTSRVITPAIWLSVNGVWKLLSININITSSITDVHIATITPPTLFIATRQGMLRVVTDSMGNVMTSQQVLIDGVLKVTVEDNTNPTSTIMYASTPRAQLYLSQDLGLTWNMTLSITSLYTSSCPYTELEHAIITSTSNMTYIAMASHQCIVIISTTTQGASFTRELSVNISTSTDVTSLAMVMINTNITYICGTGTYFGRLTRGVGFTNVATTKQASYNCKQMMYDTTSIYVASDAGLSRFTLSSQTFTDTTLTVTMPSVTEVLSSAFVAQSGMYITAAQSFPTLRGSSAGTFISHPTNTLQPTSVSYDIARGVVYTTTTSLRTIERTLPPTVAIEIPYRDIARHNMSNDCWIIVNHYVLDVTSIINIHPGGVTNLVTQCGKDATQIWNAVHMSSTLSRLPRYIIGTLSYTSIDVATHSSPSDCYIIYMDRVLNVTMYVTMYPNLINLCGTDATDSLTQTPTLTPSQIKSSFIGRLTIVADATIRTYSYAQVARHHVIHDCWVVCNQKVVDVTSLIQSGNSQISVDKCGSDFVTTNITLMNDMSSLVLGAITTPIPFATLNVANNVPTYVAPNTQVADQGMICSTFHNNGLTSSACYILDFATNTSTPLPTDLTAPYEQYLLGGTRAGVADTTAIIAVSSTGAVYVRANGVSATRPIAPWNGMIPVGIAQNPSNYWDVIVTLSSGFIYRSTDFGLTWNNITGNLPSTSISSVIVLDMDTYIATLVATHMGVYMTTDDIKIEGSWIRIGESFPLVTTSSLQYVNDYDMIIVGTLGRGLYTLSQVTNAIDNARAILLTVPITTAIPTTLAPTTTTPPTTPGGGNNIPTDPITPTSPPTTRPDVTSPPTRSTGVGAASGSTGAATSSSTTILGFDLKIAIPIMVGAVVVIIVAILLLWKWCSSRDTPLRNMRKASMDFSDAAISGAPSAPTYAMSIKFSHDVDVAKLPTQRQNAPSIYDEPAITDSPLHSAAMSPMKSSVDHGDWNARQQRMTVASGGWYEGSSQPSPTGYRQDPNYVDPQQQQQQQEYRWSQDDGQQVQQQQEYQWSQDTSQQQTWDNQSSQQQEYQWTQPESPSTQQWTQTRTWRNPSAALGWNT